MTRKGEDEQLKWLELFQIMFNKFLDFHVLNTNSRIFDKNQD